jgi:hypothetical protein
MSRTTKKPHTPHDPTTLDRLVWVRDVVVESFGTRVRVRSPDSAVVEELIRRIPIERVYEHGGDAECVVSVVAQRDRFGLYVDGVRIAQPSGFEEVASGLESAVSLHIAEHAPDRVFLHAGCIALNGRAIIVPGRTFSGKTSLVAAFLRAGATYYSDEYAVLDERGLVHPFPRLLSIRNAPGTPPDKVSAASFAAPVGVEPIEAGGVIYSTFDPERAGKPWRPRALSPGRMTLALLDNAVPARNRPGAVLLAIKHVAERALGWNGPRGEADTVVRYVLRKMR